MLPAAVSRTAPAQPPRLSRAARWLWATTLLLALISVAAGVPARYAQLRTVTPDAATILGQLTPDEAARMTASGLSLEGYAGYFTAAEVLTALVSFGVASLIVLGRPHERMALVVAYTLVASAAVLPLTGALEQQSGLWAAIALGWRAVFGCLLMPFLLLFPDGHFAPRWTRWVVVAWIGYTGLWIVLPALRPPFSFGRGLTAGEAPTAAITIGALLTGVVIQLWRFTRHSTPPERQRTKWVVFGFVMLVTGLVLGNLVLTYLVAAPIGPVNFIARLTGPTFILIGFILLAFMIGISVLRYRLWDVDVIIRRTLIYTGLTVVLAVAYLGIVVVLQAGFSVLTGEGRNELVTVISTLALAALFGPVRGRVQSAIDRRFYRSKCDAARTLAAFGAQARDVVELEQLQCQLVRVVDETMQPASVSLWVRAGGRLGEGSATNEF